MVIDFIVNTHTLILALLLLLTLVLTFTLMQVALFNQTYVELFGAMNDKVKKNLLALPIPAPSRVRPGIALRGALSTASSRRAANDGISVKSSPDM